MREIKFRAWNTRRNDGFEYFSDLSRLGKHTDALLNYRKTRCYFTATGKLPPVRR